MRETDRPKFLQAVAAMAATFRQEATEAVYEGFWLGLEDLAVEDVQCAVTQAIRTCEFMPAAAKLRELTGDVQPADRAILAWDVFQKTIQRHGYYDSVDFDDPIVNATVRNLGGWEVVSEAADLSDFRTFFRQRFEKVYAAYCRAGASTAQGAPLLGYYARENAMNGYREHIPDPARIACGLPPRRSALPRPTSVPAKQLAHADITDTIGRIPQ